MNMKFATLALSAMLGGPAFACSEPTPPAAIPSGKTASKEEMLAKKKEVDRYKRDVEAYLGCESNKQRLESAEANLEKVANRFNAEVRAFKAINGG